MLGTFRRDVELAPGDGFRLRRRAGARALSALLALAGAGWGVFDLWSGRPVIGAATLALAAAFVLQLIHAELDTWRFDGRAAVRRGVRVKAAQIRGVEVAFASGHAQAWIETRTGEQYALVEGDETQVRRIADQLILAVRAANSETLH